MLEKGDLKVSDDTQEACQHEKLEKLVDRSLWYQCGNHKCRKVFYITDALTEPLDEWLRQFSGVVIKAKKPTGKKK